MKENALTKKEERQKSERKEHKGEWKEGKEDSA